MTTSSQPQRLIIFTDGRPGPHLVITEAFLRAAQNRHDVKVVALCDTEIRAALPPLPEMAKHLVSRALFRLFNPDMKEAFSGSAFAGLRGIARRHGVPLLTPAHRNINHPDFISLLQREVRADLAVTLVCTQILKPKLLGCFTYAINCHTSLLPQHRGVAATHWSLYEGDVRTGITFHRLTEGIDEGDMLIQSALALTPADRANVLVCRKYGLAAQEADKALGLMVRHTPGTPQFDGSYHSSEDLRRIRSIDNPPSFTYDELQRRLRAFTFLQLRLAGGQFVVTRISRTNTHCGSRLAFSTRDGVRVVPTRFFFLPLSLYRLCDRLNLVPAMQEPRRTRSKGMASSE